MSSIACSAIDPPTVLVAEDDVLTRMAAAEVLREAGFEVIEASGAEEALAALHRHAASVRALFTDINMPGRIDGLELAYRARQEYPRLAVLIASGRPSPACLPPHSRFLAKPYNPDRLPGQLRALIEDPD